MAVTSRSQESEKKNYYDWYLLPRYLGLKDSPLLAWFLIGIAIRLVVMPLFAHGDLMINSTIGLALAQTGKLIQSDLPPAQVFVYAGLFKAVSPFFNLARFDFWVNPLQLNSPTLSQISFFDQSGIYTFVFLAKVPALLVDIVFGVYFVRYFQDVNSKILAAVLWALNPVDLYFTFVQGEFDIIVACLLLLSFYYFQRNKPVVSFVFLTVSVVFKIFPIILFVPFLLALTYQKKAPQRTVALAVGVSVLIFALVTVSSGLVPVFYQSTNAAAGQVSYISGFFGNTYYYRGVPQQPLIGSALTYLVAYSASLGIFGGFTNIYLTLLLLFLVILLFIYFRDSLGQSLLIMITVIFAVYYASSLFHPQWFLWVQPFLAILLITRRVPFNLYALITGLSFGYMLYWNSGNTTSLVAPLIPSAVLWKGPLDYLYALFPKPTVLIDVIRTIFSAALIFLVLALYYGGADLIGKIRSTVS